MDKEKPGMSPENVDVAERMYYQSIEQGVLPLWGTGYTHLRVVPPLNIQKNCWVRISQEWRRRSGRFGKVYSSEYIASV
ncbi:hypothetical protein GWO13_08250 [Candidatus Bathyarchaeota archaeon]|nr:hypothetical protein [Candidatus Bathyarchaeota archaeon]